MRGLSGLGVLIFLIILSFLSDIPRSILIGAWIFGGAFISKVFKTETVVIEDPDLGEITRFFSEERGVEWIAYLEIMDAELEIYLPGDSKRHIGRKAKHTFKY